MNKTPTICTTFVQRCRSRCKYQTPAAKTMQFPTITAIVPTTLIAAFPAVPCLLYSHTHFTGIVAGIFLIVANKMITPYAQLSTRLTNIKNWRIHLNTQSLLNPCTSANNALRWVAVDNKPSIQIMKKWYGTIVSSFASPTDWIPIPVMSCWSENEFSSLARMLEGEDFLRSCRRIMRTLRVMAKPAVMMKERRTWGAC